MDRQHQHPNEDIPPFFEPILDFFNSLPPITRTWFSLSLAVTGLHTLDIFHTDQLILLWDRVRTLELWRILTAFVWAGPGTMVDFPVLMLLYSMVSVVPGYEEDPHEACYIEEQQQLLQNDIIPNNNEDIRDRIVNQWTNPRRRRSRPRHRQSDCIFAFLSCSILILLTYLILMETSFMYIYITPYIYVGPPILLPIFTRTLLYSIITLHSLKHPDRQQNINFFPVPGRYVPAFHVAFGVFMKYRINETVHGVVVGLIYAYLVKEDAWLALVLGRKRLLCTPNWLIHLVGEDGNIITEEVVDARASNPYPGVRLEPGANFLHHAAAIGDVSYIQSQIDQVEFAASSPVEIVRATAHFRQGDRNGWQPLHEASRSGKLDVLKLLLEVDMIDDEPNNQGRTFRRRAGKLKINVNVRTNNNTGFTALKIVEDNHGEDNECAQLLREVGGISLGFGDVGNDE